MSIFESLKGPKQQQQNNVDINALYQQFQKNPVDFLIRSRLRIPEGVNSPQQILQYLSNTNQIPPQYKQQAAQMLNST